MFEKGTEPADLSALRIERVDSPEGNSDIGRKLWLPVAIILATALVVFLLWTWLRVDAPVMEFAEVTMVYPSQAEALLTASGYVVAQRQASIASKGTGRLQQLNVEEGDVVAKGQLIGQLESGDVNAALDQAKANLDMVRASLKKVQADFKEAKLSYERQRRLLDQKLISQSDFDIAEARYFSADANVETARAQIEVAKAAVAWAAVGVENTRIRAPFDGTVLTKNADIGEMVAPFAASSNSRGAVVTIADMNSLEVEADVSESNIQRVQVGQSCEIILDAFPDVRYPAIVHKIVPTADRAKATVLTKVRFKERDGRVLPEMSAKVNFLSVNNLSTGENKPFAAVPGSAVVRRNGRVVVYVVRGEELAEVPVTVGREFAGKTEIVQGVAAGERVVLRPDEKTSAGTHIKLNAQ